MKRYLDPKADLTFKKIFGEHPDLVISFLNALLPLEADSQIESVEYLPAEQVPRTPTRKDSIVDVKCTDQRKRQFIVEMQMSWSEEFKQRVVFNAAKAYVGQLDTGEDYDLLQPVYSLNLVNDTFENDVEDFYHYYRLVHDRYSFKVIDGLHLVFVELPKFKPQTVADRRMMVLWLRFLTEINEKTQEVPAELMEDEHVRCALELVEESAYTREEMEGYDKFWDIVSREKTLVNAARRQHAKGLEEGKAIGLEEGKAIGMEEGMAKGMMKEKLEMAKKMKAAGMPLALIIELTGLTEEAIQQSEPTNHQ